MTCVLEQQRILELAQQMRLDYGIMESDSEYSDDESIYDSEVDEEDIYNQNKCHHRRTIEKNGRMICTECGNILSDAIYDQEAYAEGGGSSRHHHRKFEERGILKELEKCNIPRSIKIEADNEYHRQVEDTIKRGRNREAIIYACVLAAYKKSPNPKNPYLIAEELGTPKRTMSRGYKIYNTKIRQQNIIYKPVNPGESRNIPQDFQYQILDALEEGDITPDKITNLGCVMLNHGNINRDSHEAIDLIKNYIEVIKREKNIIIPEDEPIKLYRHILNDFSSEDYIGDKHNSKSLTAGIIYYILKKTHHITKREFKSLVGISDITISKVVTEITNLMAKTPITT